MTTHGLGLWTRNRVARSISVADQNAILADILTRSPARTLPYGMPTAVNPFLLALGVSPGNSPMFGDLQRPYDPPTFGVAHPKLFYRDGRGYWDKVRALFETVVKQVSNLELNDALALSGAMNLETDRPRPGDDVD